MSDRAGAGSLPAGTADRVVLAADDERLGLHGGDVVVVVGHRSIEGYRRPDPVRAGSSEAWFRVRRNLGARLSATQIPHLLESFGTCEGSPVIERVLAPDRAPVILLEWRTETAAVEVELHITAGRDLELSFGRDGRDAGATRVLRTGETTSLRPTVAPGRPARLALAPAGSEVVHRLLQRLDERAAGALAAARRAHAHTPVVTFPADVGGRMARAGRACAAVIPGVRAARPQGASREGASTDGQSSGGTPALLYALCVDGMRPLAAAGATRVALARLALGDAVVAHAVLTGLAQGPAGDGQAQLPLLYGMYVAWTGRIDPPAPWRAALLRACGRWADPGAAPTPPAAVRSLVRSAAEAAHDEELVAAVGAGEGRGPDEAAGRGGSDAARPHVTPDEPAELLRLLAGPGAAAIRWPLLPERAHAEDELQSAANTVLGLIHGRLGVEPDAARGRLRLRLDLTAGGIHCEGIRLGQARVDVRADAGPARVRIEARQTGGATPLQLVLEPEVRTAGTVSARVDGRPAELSPARLATDRLRVPVQLALDARRSLVLELEPL